MIGGCGMIHAWRIEYEGVWYHVLSRGNERQDIFRDDRNLLLFCLWKTGVVTTKKIGELFGVSYSSVSHIVKLEKARLEQDKG
jgi:hypothetical protein